MSGWIRLDRRWHNTDGIKQNEPFCERAAWVWLISNAAWKETTRHGGKGDAVTIQPGQIHVSDRSLASVFGWDKKRVRRFLSRLELVGKCHLSRHDNGTVLTLENWHLYQNQGPTEGPTEGPTQDRHGTTQEQGKQGKQENNDNYAFFGRVIKLTPNDLARWQKSYSAVDVVALLQSRDDWLSDQPKDNQSKWFQSTSNWLANKNQESKKQEAGSAKLQMPIA